MIDKHTVEVPGTRRVRIAVETRTGTYQNRYVEVHQELADDDAMLMRKASDEFRRRFGYAARVVSIDIHCPQRP